MSILDVGFGSDVSTPINVLFDSCSFPNLEGISILLNPEEKEVENQDDMDPYDFEFKWIRPPSTPLVHSCPNLKKITLETLYLSRKVADFLGDIRRRTGCEICVGDFGECYVEKKRLSLERRHLLSQLYIDEDVWKDYVEDSIKEDCLYWNSLSDDLFRRVAYDAALNHHKSKITLRNCLEVIRADLAHSDDGNKRDAVKKFLQSLLAESEKYSWNRRDQPNLQKNIKYLIEYAEHH